MNIFRILLIPIFLCVFVLHSNAQLAQTIEQMEAANKECLHIKPDSGYCSKLFHEQMDSMVVVVFEKVKKQAAPSEQKKIIEEQISWAKKKGEFCKKQDETFVYNLQEGTWKKDMIRITYQQKAEYVLKRIKALLKQLQE